jgi:arginase
MHNYDIQYLSAPSILGLKSTGVERLPERFIECGLTHVIPSSYPIIEVPTYNNLRREFRDHDTSCLNSDLIHDFSTGLAKTIQTVVAGKQFAFVLGGDCSVLVGIMSGLKKAGTYGLLFIDAHADFYEPERSTTGEVADMDLAIVTGRGPEIITNINGLRPYVSDEHVIHIGQRDEQQTIEFKSRDIRETNIHCHNLQSIRARGISGEINDIAAEMSSMRVEGFWIHFDTDVLSDEINPAVDYRLPDGLQFQEAAFLLKSLLSSKKIVGISISIYNANLDPDRRIAQGIVNCLAHAFKSVS